MKKEKRKLIKFSNYSLCVTLPKSVIKDFDWGKGDEVVLEVDKENEVIHVSRANSKKPRKPKSKTQAKAKEKAGDDYSRW